MRQIAKGIDYHWSGVKEMGTYEEMECDMLIRQLEWGKILKPFLLPQRNPKAYYRLSLYSFNTPDFTLRRVDSDARHMGQDIEHADRTPTTLRTLTIEHCPFLHLKV